MGPGFGPDPLTPGVAAYIWSLEAHDGSLYAATFDPFSFLQAEGGDPGFDLWRSSNGTDWSPVLTNGFGNACNYGGRNMTSSPLGLFVGTANPFTTEDGIDNNFCPEGDTGGLEVWIGVGGE